MSKFLAVSLDGEGQFYSPRKGAGSAHLIMIDTAERAGGDFLAFADSAGKINKWCGGKLTASNLDAGLSSVVCHKCATFVDSAEYRTEIDRAASAWAEESAGTGENLSDLNTETDTGKAEKEAERKRAAKVESEAKIIAGLTDGKCAFERENSDTGEMELVTLNGRMGIMPVDGTEDMDGNGNSVGVCPVCRMVAKLTGKGAVGTHRPGNVTPEGSQLPGRAVTTVQTDGRKVREAEQSGRGEDPEEIRESLARTGERLDMIREGLEVATENDELEKLESRRVAGIAQSRELSAKLRGSERDWTSQDEGKYAPGIRDHGRSDGPAMIPLGESGYAGWKFDTTGEHATADGVARDPKVSVLGDVVGGRYGYLTGDEYRALNKTRKRRYWARVSQNKARAKVARGIQREKNKAVGQRGSGPTASRPYLNEVDGVRMDAKPESTKGSTLNGQSATVTK